MRLRAMGMAMFFLGVSGAIASFGAWWFQFRYGKSIGDAVGAHIACTQHCGGVDGPYLGALIASAAVAVVGLVVAVAQLALGSRRPTL